MTPASFALVQCLYQFLNQFRGITFICHRHTKSSRPAPLDASAALRHVHLQPSVANAASRDKHLECQTLTAIVASFRRRFQHWLGIFCTTEFRVLSSWSSDGAFSRLYLSQAQ